MKNEDPFVAGKRSASERLRDVVEELDVALRVLEKVTVVVENKQR